jgi:hypothetical protein
LGTGVEGRRVRNGSANKQKTARRRAILAATIIAILAMGGLAFALSRDRATTVATLSNAALSSSAPSVVASAGSDASAPVAEGVSDEPTGTVRSAPTDAATPNTVPAGAKLAVVPTAPPGTLGSLRLPDDVSRARLAVTFEVYGWAPEGAGGTKRLAVHVVSAKPTDAGSKVQELSGENAVFSLASYDGPPVNEGGRYEGTLQVRAEDGGRGAMYLLSARPVR